MDGKVLVIRRIHVRHHLTCAAASREIAERVHGFHADVCPVARTLKGCIEISTSLDVTEDS